MSDLEDFYRPPAHQLIGGLARAAAKWALILSLFRQIVSIGTTMLVSRFVSPEEFGIAGMVLSFVAFLVLFDTGLTWATVQSPELDRNKVDSLFVFGFLLGALLWIGTVFLAPYLASFYSQPALESIAIAMGAAVFINSLTTQPAALLKRQLRQKETNYIDTIALFLSSLVAIYSALTGGGYWAVIAQAVVLQVVRSVLLFIYSGYHPAWPTSFKTALPELKKGAWLALSNYICYFQLYLGGIFVGRLFGSTVLGNYQKAYGVKSMPTAYATMIVTDVMVSSLAALGSDRTRMGVAYQKALRLTAFVGCPAGAMLYACAPEVIHILYGEQWVGAVPLLEWFALAATALPISTTTIWLFLASGRAQLQLRMNFFLSLISAIGLLSVTYIKGTVEALVAVESVLLAGPFLIVNIYFSHRAIGLNVGSSFKILLPVLAGCLFAVSGAVLIGECFSLTDWVVVFFIKIVVGVFLYLLVYILIEKKLPFEFSRFVSR